MKYKLLAAVSAAALSLSLVSGGPLLAQQQQLSDSAAMGMAGLGINASDMMVTADQAALIQNVLSSADTDSIKKAQIEKILGNEAVETQRLGTDQLRSTASQAMGKLGMPDSAVATMSVEQLAAIVNISGANYSDDQKRAQIETVVHGNLPGAGQMGASDEKVMTDIATLGIDTSTVGMLSADQVAQIQNVLAGTDTDALKRQQIEAIIAD